MIYGIKRRDQLYNLPNFLLCKLLKIGVSTFKHKPWKKMLKILWLLLQKETYKLERVNKCDWCHIKNIINKFFSHILFYGLKVG